MRSQNYTLSHFEKIRFWKKNGKIGLEKFE